MRRISRLSVGLLALSLALVLPGCGSSSRGGDGEADVKLIVEVSQASPLATFVDCGNFVLPTKDWTLSNVAKAPPTTGGISGVGDLYTDILVEKFTVGYTAYDGGQVVYKDVPAPMVLPIGGTVIDTEGTKDITGVPMVVTGVCNLPPLNGDPGGDPLPINATARACWFGRTVAGDPVEGCTELFILFCNSNDNNCP